MPCNLTTGRRFDRGERKTEREGGKHEGIDYITRRLFDSVLPVTKVTLLEVVLCSLTPHQHNTNHYTK